MLWGISKMALPFFYYFNNVSTGVTNLTSIEIEYLGGIADSSNLNLEYLFSVIPSTNLSLEYIGGVLNSGESNLEHLLAAAGSGILPNEIIPLGAPRPLTGSVVADFFFNFMENDNGFIYNDTGKIDYKLPLNSGLGNGEISQLFYENAAISGTGVYSLQNIQFSRFNLNPHIDTIPCRRIKGVHFENDAATNLLVKFPYYNTNDYTIVPPSGEITISSMWGWPISSGDNIELSGNGPYSIAFFG